VSTTKTSIALVLAVAGIAAIFVAVGADSWPLVVGWSVAVVVFGSAWRLLSEHHRLRLAIASAAVPILVVLTWEGGLFLLPAALVAVAATLPAAPARSG
jgi:hypothetical protein